MMRVYVAPDGSTWWYEEGEQPAGYIAATDPTNPGYVEPDDGGGGGGGGGGGSGDDNDIWIAREDGILCLMEDEDQ